MDIKDLIERIQEATKLRLSSEDKMKSYYKDSLNGELVNSTYPSIEERNWKKFWLLTDGTIIPVTYSHGRSAMDAGVNYYTLMSKHAIAGSVIEKDKMLSLRIDPTEVSITPSQIQSIIKLYNRYHVPIISTSKERVHTGSGREVSKYLKTGTKPRRQEFESIDFNIVKQARNVSKEDFINKFVIKEKGRWGTTHFAFIGNRGNYQLEGNIVGDSPEEVYNKFQRVNEDLSTIQDPKLRKRFIEDRIEQINIKMKELEKLAKAEKKGEVRSSIYAKIDELEREKTTLLKN